MRRYGTEQKEIKFVIDEKKHVDLRIRLRHDDLSQVGFFKALVEGYLDNNQLLIEYIHKYKERENIQSAAKRKKSAKLLEAGRETEHQFAFSADEIENIFDIIETGEDEY